MCGRFTKNYNFKQIQEYLNLIPSRAPSNFPPDFSAGKRFDHLCGRGLEAGLVSTGHGRPIQAEKPAFSRAA